MGLVTAAGMPMVPSAWELGSPDLVYSCSNTQAPSACDRDCKFDVLPPSQVTSQTAISGSLSPSRHDCGTRGGLSQAATWLQYHIITGPACRTLPLIMFCCQISKPSQRVTAVVAQPIVVE
eukprot:GHUV01054483.1.p1 GENE.GHUV01054483.1~~GHUV01054483.1.p1  ORF type:complete len:121 (+),score=17.02 GHUV01054483.1:173-535(+)